MVCDATLYVNLNDGTEISTVTEGLYEFIMPDHDVEISITIISNGLA